MKKVFVASLILLGFSASAQEEIKGGPVNVPSDGIIDGVFIQEHIPTKRMIPYEYVREADAVWSRRVWESIDLREKINLPLYYPLDEISRTGVWTKNASRWSLWTIIRTHVLNGDLTVFSPYNPILLGFGGMDGDQLKYPIKPQPGLNFYTDTAFQASLSRYLAEIGQQGTTPLIDEDPNSPTYGQNLVVTDANGLQSFVYDPPDTTWFVSEDIVQYRIKEDWFLDKERSILDKRIIAICPVRYRKDKDPNGRVQIQGLEEMFWLYFPHCRFVFNNYFVYNDKNDAQWMSFDDLFWKRRFNAVAYKESNTYDRDIETYRVGVDALWESERIKNEIRNIEHDVWSF